jgi:hypothetical protein
MSKIVTLRVAEPVYEIFRAMSERENRALSNFIETAALRYVEEHERVDEFEMREISGNEPLKASLKRAHEDVAAGRGRFV